MDPTTRRVLIVIALVAAVLAVVAAVPGVPLPAFPWLAIAVLLLCIERIG
jgi:hypothetical protein